MQDSMCKHENGLFRRISHMCSTELLVLQSVFQVQNWHLPLLTDSAGASGESGQYSAPWTASTLAAEDSWMAGVMTRRKVDETSWTWADEDLFGPGFILMMFVPAGLPWLLSEFDDVPPINIPFGTCRTVKLPLRVLARNQLGVTFIQGVLISSMLSFFDGSKMTH